MHLYSAEINVGKNPVTMTVFRPTRTNKTNTDALTPAEVMVLRKLHGDDSVRNIEYWGNDRRTSKAERDRLIGLYGAKSFESVFGPVAAMPKMPEELDLTPPEEDEDDGVPVEPRGPDVVLSGGAAAAYDESTSDAPGGLSTLVHSAYNERNGVGEAHKPRAILTLNRELVAA